MQRRERPGQCYETAARDFCRSVEIQHTQFLTKIDMIFWREIKLWRLTPAAYFDVIVFIFPVRYGGVRDIRDAEHYFIQFFLDTNELCLGFLQLITEAGNLFH